MPKKPLRPCAEISCGNLTEKAYCKTHEKIGEENRRDFTRKYNQYGRNPEINSFYQSSAWKQLRSLAYNRDNGLCQRCLKQGVIQQAHIVHHIVEVKDDWNRRLDIDNLESVCHVCHNREHKGTPRG